MTDRRKSTVAFKRATVQKTVVQPRESDFVRTFAVVKNLETASTKAMSGTCHAHEAVLPGNKAELSLSGLNSPFRPDPICRFHGNPTRQTEYCVE